MLKTVAILSAFVAAAHAVRYEGRRLAHAAPLYCFTAFPLSQPPSLDYPARDCEILSHSSFVFSPPLLHHHKSLPLSPAAGTRFATRQPRRRQNMHQADRPMSGSPVCRRPASRLLVSHNTTRECHFLTTKISNKNKNTTYALNALLRCAFVSSSAQSSSTSTHDDTRTFIAREERRPTPLASYRIL